MILFITLLLLSLILESISSYFIFQILIDNQINSIDTTTSVIKNKLEKLYQKQTNLQEIPNLNSLKDKDLIRSIEKNFPGYELKIPTVEGTLSYKETPRLIYNHKEDAYYLEITREINFSENLPFKSLQLSIKLNYYQIIFKSLVFGTLITAFILIFVIIFFSRSIVKPIKKISKGVKQIAAGELDINIDYKSEDELGELSNSFNFMTKELANIKKIRDDLLATVSHELRSPLGRIKGYTELLSDLKLKSNEQTVYFKSIFQEVDLLNEMIGEIIEISRLELNKEQLFKEQIDLAFFFELLNEDLEIEKSITKIKYYFDYEYGLFCKVDVDKLRRVFQNIFQNSIKAKAGEIFISAKRNDKKINIIISDDGIGIPPDQLEIVFEKFYRVDKSRDRKTGGFGLGLAICKGIIREHNGNIYFSKKEKGAELHIELPLSIS
jgi:signal transduction histidine kinase